MRIAVIGALKSEIIHLLNIFRNLEKMPARGLCVFKGGAAGHEFYFAVSGVGQLKSAAVTAALIERCCPEHIILTGSCGAVAPGVSKGDIVIAKSIIYHDIEDRFLAVLSDRLKKNFYRFAAPSSVFPFFENKFQDGKLHRGIVLSGNNPVAGTARKEELYKKWGGLCAEMEGAGFATACETAGVPWSVVRIVTDECGDLELITAGREEPLLLKKLAAYLRTSLGLR